jgi:hypothetical protein
MTTAIFEVPDVMTRRLQATPAVATNVRLSHRVPVTRNDAPAVYVKPGDNRQEGATKDCVRRVQTVRVHVLVRSDEGVAAIDALVESVTNRLERTTAVVGATYPRGAQVTLKSALFEDELADEDCVLVALEYEIAYNASGALLAVA